MKKTIPIIIAVVWVLSITVCQAKEPGEVAEDFFAMVKAGKISDAFDTLFIGSEIPYLQPMQIQTLQEQTANALQAYGNVVGYEKIREEKFGKSIVRCIYVLNLEKAPLVWEFYFYQPKGQWFVGKVAFNDRFQQLQKME